MDLFLKKKKLISLILLFSLTIGFSPIFATKTLAQTGPALIAAEGAAVLSAAAPFNGVCSPLVWGSGWACDPGTRYNTLAILSTALGVTGGVAQKEAVWDGIAYFLARILIRQLSQSIVTWINSGFQGNPSFVQNPGKFMAEVGDRAIGEFIFGSDLGFLCSPFETNIRINLGYKYSPFKDKINCTLSGILKNVDGSVTNAYNDFMDGDFINGGGWDSWLNITTNPQNNQIGAQLIAEAELTARIGEKELIKKDELNWSGGLLSMKNCTRITKDANGVQTNAESYRGDPAFFQKVGTQTGSGQLVRDTSGTITGSTEDACEIVTPGTWITGSGNKVFGMDLDALGVADELDEIIGALANFVISKVIQKGVSLLTGDDLSSDNADWREGIAAMEAQQNQQGQEAVTDVQARANNNGGNTNNGGNINNNINITPVNDSTTIVTYNTSGTVDFSKTFDTRAEILKAIEEQTLNETNYLYTQNNTILLLLTTSQNVFASSNCSATDKTMVINQITGDYTGARDLVWNIKDASGAATTTNNNLALLNTSKTAVSNQLYNISDASIQTAIQNLAANTTFHSPATVNNYSLGGAIFNTIRGWIANKITALGSTCSIDKSSLAEWGI